MAFPIIHQSSRKTPVSEAWTIENKLYVTPDETEPDVINITVSKIKYWKDQKYPTSRDTNSISVSKEQLGDLIKDIMIYYGK